MRFFSFAEMLTHFAEISPDAGAFVYRDSDGRCAAVTYAEFLARVKARSEELRAMGKTCAGVLCTGDIECVTEIFASVLSEMQTVLLDPVLPDETLAEQIAVCDIDLLLPAKGRAAALSSSLTDGTADGGGKVLFFTSGTTDSARAVVLTERSLCSSAYNGGAMLPLSSSDVLFCALPLNHVFGFICGMLWGLSFGATVALSGGMRSFVSDLSELSPTAAAFVPILLQVCLKHGLFPPSLQTVLVGAGTCPPKWLEDLKRKNIRVSFGYGLTETSSGVAISVDGDPFLMRVCPDDRISIAEDGEVLIEAPTCMMEGYYKDPAATAMVLQNGVLHSGDLGEMDAEGRLRITGRKKEILVLVDGTKIFLPVYEKEISRLLNTEDVCVGFSGGALTLFLPFPLEKESEVKEKLNVIMAKYPPSQRIRLVRCLGMPLPRTGSGKIRRWALGQS